MVGDLIVADVGGVVFDGCDPHNFMELSVEH